MKFRQIVARFKGKIFITFFLVLVEAGLAILFPLFIGYAIDDVLGSEPAGPAWLGALGMFALLVGAARRVYDSRAYAKIYETTGLEMVEAQGDSTVSQKTARLNMMKEVIEFLENVLPELVQNVIGLGGTLIIVAFLDWRVFAGCLLLLVIVAVVYSLTSKKTVRFNQEFNDELERQVDAVASKDRGRLSAHITRAMKWNIKLSDLETVNFSVVWTFMMGLLVLSILLAVDQGTVQYGAVFALVMYVFQFIENTTNLPLYYQQWLRLVEITGRLEKME